MLANKSETQCWVDMAAGGGFKSSLYVSHQTQTGRIAGSAAVDGPKTGRDELYVHAPENTNAF